MEEKIKQILKDIFSKEITDDFRQENEDNWDSLTHLDIIVALEDEFKTSFTPEEIGDMTSLKKIVDIIKTHED